MCTARRTRRVATERRTARGDCDSLQLGQTPSAYRTMKFAAEFLATFCTAIFAGAAVYINAVEHPARIECGTSLAATVFGPSYRRAAIMQASLASAAFVAAVAAWHMTAVLSWLIGASLIVAVIPFTLIVVLPLNKRLLDPILDRNSPAALRLLTRWGHLHMVRTVLSVAALAVFLFLL